MKKALFFALLVSCISFSQAQVLSFSYNYETIADGDTVILQAQANNEFQFTPAIRNDELFNLVCIIECSKLNNTTSEIVSVCTGLLCKDGYVSAPFALAGNTTYDETHIDFDVPADAEMGLFKITVYDTNNRNTQATMYVKMYNKNSNLGIAESGKTVNLTAYPNPATSEVAIDYSFDGNRGNLVVYAAGEGADIEADSALFRVEGNFACHFAIHRVDNQIAAVSIERVVDGDFACGRVGIGGQVDGLAALGNA